MKLQALEPPLEEELGAGVTAVVSHVGPGPEGLPRARLTIWSGDRLLAADVIELDVAAARRRLVKQAAEVVPQAGTRPGAGRRGACVLSRGAAPGVVRAGGRK